VGQFPAKLKFVCPEALRLAEPVWLDLQKFIEQRLLVTDYDLRTATWRFPNCLQKGSVGFALTK
jgi:hypothetical protein